MSKLENLITKYYGDVSPENWKACENITSESANCVECCRNQYFDGNDVSYDCEHKRKIYVIRYLPVHQKEIYLALSRTPQKVAASIAERKNIKVLSIGSGPGSDIFAFQKAILDKKLFIGGIKDISVIMVEKEKGWNDISDDVLHLHENSDLNYSFNKQYFDFSIKRVNNTISFDYILLSYVVSELDHKMIDNISENLKNCIGNLSVLIINDRNEELVVQKINYLLNKLKVNQSENNSVREWCGVSYPDEIKENIKPKLKTNSIQYTVVVQP